MGDGEWLSYGDAAIRLGITPDAVRQRVKRGRMKAARTNSGHPVVWVADRDKPDKPVVTNRTVTTEQTGQTEQRDAALDRLAEAYATFERELRRRAEAAEARIDRAEEQAAAARQEAREARGRADGMVDRLADLERARSAAEAERDRLRAELEHARRPWWRRLRRGIAGRKTR